MIPLGALVAAVFLGAYIAFCRTFHPFPRETRKADTVDLPQGKEYEVHWEAMTKWALETRQMPCQRLSVRSFDGLTLKASYYEYAPGAPIEMMFHGYRGNPERDLSGGVQRCFHAGRSCLMVEQRGCAESEGRTITFGIHERRDCLRWVEYVVEHFGPDVKIILTGMSMGAATVLMAAGEPLPPNVVGVLADCGYTTPREIIQKVMGEMGLPVRLTYPLVKLGARLYGHFDLEEASPLDAMKRCKVPVLFIHGEADSYVPCEMSLRNYEACASRKRLLTVPGAEHGLSCLVGQEQYMRALRDFFGEELSYRK